MAAKMRSVCVWETAAVILAFAVAAVIADSKVALFTFSSGTATGQTAGLFDAGTSVSLRCRVEYNSTRAPTVYLKKRFPNATTVRISTNDVVDEENYAVFGSKVSINPMDTQPNGADVYEWTIKNLVVGDSGNYVCYTGAGTANGTSAIVSLNVTAEPSLINFYVNDELLPPSWPTAPIQKLLKIGQTYRLRCVASGANPFPNVTLSSGSTVFTPVSNDTATVRQDVAIPDVVNRSTSVSVQWTMDKSSVGKPIVCTAGVKKVNATVYSFIPVFDNAVPQFSCADIATYDSKQSSFAISCNVYGPNMTTFYVNWHNATANVSIVGSQNRNVQSPVDGRYSLFVKAPANSSSIWWTMTLNINDVKTITDLTRIDYHFVANNNVGQAVHTVDVQSSGTAKNPTSAAGHMFLSTTGFTAALFCALTAAIFGHL